MKKGFVLLIVLFMAAAMAQPSVDGVINDGEYDSSYTHEDSGSVISWTIAGDTIYIGLSTENDGWVGLGLLQEKVEKKQGADQYLFVMDGGSLTALDMTQVDPKDSPAMDDEQGGSQSILESAATLDGEVWTVEFSRKLDTGEATDMLITPGETFTLLLAKGKEMDKEEEHRKNRRWELEDFAF
ncbi:MAG: hypothetical protein KC422_03430 [Trueperaceae bacterium]|nr:hypothetical protein [Trueperaceae bacterium]